MTVCPWNASLDMPMPRSYAPLFLPMSGEEPPKCWQMMPQPMCLLTTKPPADGASNTRLTRVDGDNRIGGNAITEIIVFGKRAGDSAAEYAASASEAHAAREQIEPEQEQVSGLLEQSGEVSTVAAKRELQRLEHYLKCFEQNQLRRQ